MADNILVRSASSAIEVQDDDTPIVSAASILNFEGNAVVTDDGGGKATITVSGSTQNLFETIAVSGQSNVVADSATDTLTLAAGTGISITTNATTDTITITNSSPNVNQNLFQTIAVSGQSNVVADSATDTLTLVAGTGITITTSAAADSVTITNSRVFGNNFQVAQSLGVSTTTSTTFQNKVTLSAGTLPAGTYRIGVSYGWNHDSTTDGFEGEVQQNGVTLGEIHQQEPQDSGGTFSTTGTNQRHYLTRVYYRTLTSASYTYTLNFRTNAGGTESSIWDAIIELWRVS